MNVKNIKEVDVSCQKEIFEYLIHNRIFLENLSYRDMERYYKLLKELKKERNKNDFFEFIHFCLGGHC